MDLAQYSDADLAQIAGTPVSSAQANAQTPSSSPTDLSSLSDADLSKIAGAPQEAQQTIPANAQGQQQRDPRLLADEPGQEYGGILPFSKDTATGDVSLAWPEFVRSPVRGLQDLEAGAKEAQETGMPTMTPDAVNAMLAMFLPSSQKAPEKSSVIPAIDESTGGGGGGGNAQILNFLKDQSSGGNTPSFLRPAKPIPAGLTATDSGAPLLVTAKDIKQGQADIQPFLQNDGIDLNKVADHLEQAQKVNPNVTALDVMAKDEGGIPGGSNMIGLAKSIAQSPGQGRTMAAEMTNRGYSASQRIGNSFDANISRSPYYNVQSDAIQQMEGSGDLYNKAYAANQNVDSPVINRLLKTDAGKQALSYAANRMNTKMSLMGVPDPELAEQARLTGQYQSGGISKGLKLQTFQYVKEGYDNLISSAFNAGEKGKAADLIEQKNGLLGELDKIDQQTTGGAYAKARATYATGAKVKESLENGRNFMNLDPEEIQDFISDKGRSNPEKVAFATGVRRALQDKIDNAPETRNPINALWKPNLQKRLQPLFPDQKSFNDFATNMEHEKTMSRVNQIVQGSPTYQNAAFSKTPQSTAIGKGLRFLGNAMEPGVYVSKLGDFADKALTEQAQNMSQNSKTVIMRYLTTKDPNLLRDLANQSTPVAKTAATK